MADEQTIYLSPEEELTSVRERLERTQARRIILIIPQQTQLRSHVGWRLIHARMRELNKDLVVISPDRQVRAVARAAGFQVAETQEIPSQRPRQGSNTTRQGNPPRGSNTRARPGSTRVGPESGPTTQRRSPQSSASQRPAMPPSRPLPEQYFEDEETTFERPRKQSQGLSDKQVLSPTPLFEESEDKFGPAYDFHIGATPAVRPSVPYMEEEAEDLKYYKDYHTAQRIRESASRADEPPAEHIAPTTTNGGARESRTAPASHVGSDPYAYLEEDQQRSTLPEQKGSLAGPLDDIGTDAPDISDRSTEIMPSEIEDLGDMGTLDLPEWLLAPAPEKPATPPRTQEPRPRRRTGQMSPQAARPPRDLRPSTQDFTDDEELAQPARPSQMSTSTGRPSKNLTGTPTARPSKNLANASASPRPTQTRNTGAAAQAGAPAPATAQRAPGRSLVSVPGATASTRRKPRRSNRGLAFFFIVIALLLAVAGLLFYLVPSATVTIALQAQKFSQTVQLDATLNPQANVAGQLPAQLLQHDFSASGQGTASGTTQAGNALATGKVDFTNNGKDPVTVPSGTVIATTSGIQFATGANFVISTGTNNTWPGVPVSARQSGESGNVGAGSITIIPTTSLQSLAKENNVNASTLNLVVTNPQATSGGGVANAPAVTQQDLQTLTRSLHQKLQQQVSAWLTSPLCACAVHGSLVPDVLGSTGPISEEQLSGAPSVGQVASGGSFTGTLSLHVSVLVARAADLQAAAGKQLNAAALKLQPPSTLANQLPVTLTNTKSTSSKDGKSLAISAQASAEVYRALPANDIQTIQSALTGKSITQATGELRSSLAQAGFVDAQINVSPGFLSILPLRADRIQVVLKPVPQATKANLPNA